MNKCSHTTRNKTSPDPFPRHGEAPRLERHDMDVLERLKWRHHRGRMQTCDGAKIGGLQDQMGFKKEDGSYLTTEDFDENWPSNSNGRYKEHGEWAFPVWPTLTLQGSPMTPYIYDSIPSITDISSRIEEAYGLGTEELNRRGALGREYVTSKNIMMTSKMMAENTIDSIENMMKEWKPRKRFSLIEVSQNENVIYPKGIIK